MEERESTLHTGDHEDFCNKCGIGGKLICCDFCPKVYHLQCLEPRLNETPPDIWPCPSCASRMYLTKNDLSIVILGRRVSQFLKKNYKQAGFDAVQAMLRVMQAAAVMQRDDLALGQYAREMRQDLFGDIVHSTLRGVYRYSSMWCAVLCMSPAVRFLGMYDSAEDAHAAFQKARVYFTPIIGDESSPELAAEKPKLQRRASTVAVISSKFKLVLDGDPSKHHNGNGKSVAKPAGFSAGYEPQSIGSYGTWAPPSMTETNVQRTKDTNSYLQPYFPWSDGSQPTIESRPPLPPQQQQQQYQQQQQHQQLLLHHHHYQLQQPQLQPQPQPQHYQQQQQLLPSHGFTAVPSMNQAWHPHPPQAGTQFHVQNDTNSYASYPPPQMQMEHGHIPQVPSRHVSQYFQHTPTGLPSYSHPPQQMNSVHQAQPSFQPYNYQIVGDWSNGTAGHYAPAATTSMHLSAQSVQSDVRNFPAHIRTQLSPADAIQPSPALQPVQTTTYHPGDGVTVMYHLEDGSSDYELDESVSLGSISDLDDTVLGGDFYSESYAPGGYSTAGAGAFPAPTPQTMAMPTGASVTVPLTISPETVSAGESSSEGATGEVPSASIAHSSQILPANSTTAVPSTSSTPSPARKEKRSHKLHKGRRRVRGDQPVARKRLKTITAGPGAWGVKVERDLPDVDADALTRAERRKRQLRGLYSPPAISIEHQAIVPLWQAPDDADGTGAAADSTEELYSPATPGPDTPPLRAPWDDLSLSEADILLAQEAFMMYEDDLTSVRHVLKWPMKHIVSFYYRVWQISPLGYVMQQLRNQRSIELLIKRGTPFASLYGVRSSKRNK